ncbi:DUF2163 domain-containing protein [Mesorhizobium sp. KR2-14]|uniref:DUF2163 domain-containing protein n=1 Tax=Mesorhizobium sp. KR2-14 TaxID=3156610 RepID=UPI0032B5ABAB
MSAYPQALAEHLSRDVTTVCHCWRLTRTDGAASGYTDHDRALTVDGLTFEPETGFSASEARETLGLAVDTADVEGALSSANISDEDIAAGLYDNAKLETFLVNWRRPEQFVLLRTATIGKITRSDQRFVAELESLTRALEQPNGRYIGRACDAELGDRRCRFALDREGYSATGEVSSHEEDGTIIVTGLEAFAPGWFSHGVMVWTSGARAGRSERIVAHRRDMRGVALTLRPAVGPEIRAGNTYSITAGCDKSFATCKAKFSNALNFQGFPHLPGNDAAYGYIVEGGQFDGKPIVP